MTRAIIHADMDAFYASVEQKDNPALAGKPVIVGGAAESRGVVSAASYESRQFGVHSAMPTARAQRLCPHGVFLPVRMARYQVVSRQIRGLFECYTPLVEPLSLDEAFLDVTGSVRLFGPAAEIGRKLKAEVRQKTGLTVSIGVAPNKFLAKLASDYGKPDGFVEVTDEAKLAFLEPLEVTRLWGVGGATARVLRECGVRTIGHLREVPLDLLERKLGTSAETLLDLGNGEDDREVVPDAEAKSIGSESTFPVDVSDIYALETVALKHAETVASRLRACGLRARTVHLKVRFSDFTLTTRSATLDEATDRTDLIAGAATDLLRRHEHVRRRSVRLIGVSASQLTSCGEHQLQLFGPNDDQRQRNLDQAVDTIREKLGEHSIRRHGRPKTGDQRPKT